MPEILATYRLQLHAGFTLADARALVPYLRRLGVSHLHCSPLLRSRQGSTHGYDVVDPTMLDPELGSEADLAALHQALAGQGMGLVLDIVPNHMAASHENPAWEDVLTHGPASRYARWFDIDWRTSEPDLRSRVLLPVLGDPRAHALERGEIALAVRSGVPRVGYFEHSFPLDPSTLPAVLRPALARCRDRLGPDHPRCTALAEAIDRLRRMPRRTTRRAGAAEERRRSAAVALEGLTLAAEDPAVRGEMEAAIADFGAGPDGAARLGRLLDAQVYRLVHWRRAAREINYRRFFDVNDLVALHMEDPEVFAQTHALVLDWRARGWVDGFRIDHPDGLLDPRAYLDRLASAAFPGAEGSPPIFVEKILSHGEHLRADWPVAGTTGYDFLNLAEALFIPADGFAALEADYRRVIRQPLAFPDLVRQGKRLVLETALSAGVRRLAERLHRLGRSRPVAAPPVGALARAIAETIVALPVYRTYVDDRTPVPAGEDRCLLRGALQEARARGRATAGAMDLLEEALLAHEGPMRTPEHEGARLRLVQRFQQLSGPAAAKGVEDTAFYAYAPLLSRNEVGGGPEAPLDRALAEFHAGNAERAARWPRSLLAVTTHDTKRTADVRARLDQLAELPEEWVERLDQWRRINVAFKSTVRGRRLPDPGTVHHLFQAMVGIWPQEPPAVGALEELRGRIGEYMLKATREAKRRTSWTDPDPGFEAALEVDIGALFSPARSPRLLDDLERWVARIAPAGWWTSAARVILHLASPGIPDLYQGDELGFLALVDPDNRRPVDYARRAALLEEVEREWAGEGEVRHRFLRGLLETPEDGRLKLHLIRTALAARRACPSAFRSTTYLPLAAQGAEAARVVAFARGEGQDRILVAVPRHLGSRVPGEDTSPLAGWAGTVLPLPSGWPARWTCALSGERIDAAGGAVPIDELFARLPAALLLPDDHR
ncbi:MAG TPA: malto-oligosyltrehalose synthase [Gemmatimonadales bacterium]|nr:malto-oligosyltrehalose synthase [Gemmatimonadales bacterium]